MLHSKSLTIVFTDMKNFTQQMSQFSRVEAMELVKMHENLLLPVLEAFGGKLVKTIGDSFLVTFESPTNAVLAGMELQRILREHNASLTDPQKRIEVRVAIHTGEVTVTDNDVYGDAVNVASRILGIAEANEVYFTESVYLSMNRREVPSSEIGDRYLKGVAEKVKVYKVLKETLPIPPVAGAAPAAAPEKLAAPASPPVQAPAAAAQTPAPVPAAAGSPAQAEAAAPAGRRYGGFWIRLAAILVDNAIVVVAIGFLAGAIFKESFRLPRHHLAILIALMLYYFLCWTYLSTTPGKKFFGLKILTEDGRRIDSKTAAMRLLGYWISTLFICLGYLWIALDPKKQGWHDKIAKTVVVRG